MMIMPYDNNNNNNNEFLIHIYSKCSEMSIISVKVSSVRVETVNRKANIYSQRCFVHEILHSRVVRIIILRCEREGQPVTTQNIHVCLTLIYVRH